MSGRRAELALGPGVAVKLVDAALSSRPDLRFRLVREVTAAARISSAHVVSILDHGFTTGGRAFIVMERLHGSDLGQRLARTRWMTPDELASIILPACAGLEAGHALGIVHGNIEPENVFLHEADGRLVIKLLNFGMMKSLDATPEAVGSRAALGHSTYASPERVQGHVADPRSDLYSLGLVAYRCLAGHLPLEHAAMGPGRHAPGPRSTSNPSVPASLDEWFAGMLRHDPDARLCQSAAEFASSFAAACGPSLRPAVGLPRLAERPSDAELSSAAAIGPRAAEPRAIEPTAIRPRAIRPRVLRVGRARATLGSAILVAAAGATFWFWPRLREATPPLEPRGALKPPASGASPSTVHVTLSVFPREAILTLDGQRLDHNPFSTTRTADTAIHRLRAEAPGHEPTEREIRLDRDATLELRLSPVAAASHGAPSANPALNGEPRHSARPNRLATTPHPQPIDGPVPAEARPERQTSKRPLLVDRSNPWQEP
jgi:serine/threonine protein kinase